MLFEIMSKCSQNEDEKVFFFKSRYLLKWVILLSFCFTDSTIYSVRTYPIGFLGTGLNFLVGDERKNDVARKDDLFLKDEWLRDRLVANVFVRLYLSLLCLSLLCLRRRLGHLHLLLRLRYGCLGQLRHGWVRVLWQLNQLRLRQRLKRQLHRCLRLNRHLLGHLRVIVGWCNDAVDTDMLVRLRLVLICNMAIEVIGAG